MRLAGVLLLCAAGSIGAGALVGALGPLILGVGVALGAAVWAATE